MINEFSGCRSQICGSLSMYQSFWFVLFLCAPEPGHIFTGHAFGLIGISPLRGSHRGASHCSDGSRLCFRCSLHNGDTSIPLCLVIAFAAVALRRQRTVKAKVYRSFTGAHGAYRLTADSRENVVNILIFNFQGTDLFSQKEKQTKKTISSLISSLKRKNSTPSGKIF